MAIEKVRELSDGATLVRDTDDGRTAVLKPGVYREAMSRADVEAAVAEAGDVWERERGPDSEIGRGMEAGTPSTDHSSEPTGGPD